jgi:hypothetical protein
VREEVLADVAVRERGEAGHKRLAVAIADVRLDRDGDLRAGLLLDVLGGLHHQLALHGVVLELGVALLRVSGRDLQGALEVADVDDLEAVLVQRRGAAETAVVVKAS